MFHYLFQCMFTSLNMFCIFICSTFLIIWSLYMYLFCWWAVKKSLSHWPAVGIFHLPLQMWMEWECLLFEGLWWISPPTWGKPPKTHLVMIRKFVFCRIASDIFLNSSFATNKGSSTPQTSCSAYFRRSLSTLQSISAKPAGRYKFLFHIGYCFSEPF